MNKVKHKNLKTIKNANKICKAKSKKRIKDKKNRLLHYMSHVMRIISTKMVENQESGFGSTLKRIKKIKQ